MSNLGELKIEFNNPIHLANVKYDLNEGSRALQDETFLEIH